MTILYADDDADDCELLTEALSHIDPSISCITANDGREALQILQETRVLPDSVFLDVNMPVMDGKECLIEIKKNPRLREIPVIIYSTTTDLGEKARLHDLGAFEFINKANTFSELRKNLDAVLTRLKAETW